MHLPLRPIFRQSHPNFINVRTAYASKIWAQLTKNLLAKSSTKDSESTYVKTGGGIKMRKLDMAWINGNIYTADDKFSTVAAFGVSGDRFSVVGSTEEVLENCDEHTKIIDLQGKTVLLD